MDQPFFVRKPLEFTATNGTDFAGIELIGDTIPGYLEGFSLRLEAGDTASDVKGKFYTRFAEANPAGSLTEDPDDIVNDFRIAEFSVTPLTASATATSVDEAISAPKGFKNGLWFAGEFTTTDTTDQQVWVCVWGRKGR